MNVHATDERAGAGPSPAAPRRYPVTPWSAQRLYRPFIYAAVWVAFIFGFGTGAAMMLAPALGFDRGLWWPVHGQAHGVAQLFGWAGLFMMGVAFHVVPRFRNGPMDYPWPQRGILVLVLAGVTLRFFGQSFHRRSFSPELLDASGVVLLAGVVLFAAVLIRALVRGRNARTGVEAWLWAGVVWAVVAAVLHARIVFRMGDTHASLAPGLWDLAMIGAGLIGFLTIFILGVSTRAVVGFLSLAPTRRWLVWVAWVALNAGTAWYVVARYDGWPEKWTAPGMLLQAAGFVAFVVALRVFERPTRRASYIEGTYVRYEWFIKVAFGWLLVAAALMALDAVGMISGDPVLTEPLAAPITHALTLGFITMMIFGVGLRMMTLFEGSEAPLRRLMDFAFIAINLSVGLRVAFGFFGLPGADQVQGVSGVLGLSALVAFALVLRGVFSPKQKAVYARRAAAAGLQRFATVQVARPAGRDRPESN